MEYFYEMTPARQKRIRKKIAKGTVGFLTPFLINTMFDALENAKKDLSLKELVKSRKVLGTMVCYFEKLPPLFHEISLTTKEKIIKETKKTLKNCVLPVEFSDNTERHLNVFSRLDVESDYLQLAVNSDCLSLLDRASQKYEQICGKKIKLFLEEYPELAQGMYLDRSFFLMGEVYLNNYEEYSKQYLE